MSYSDFRPSSISQQHQYIPGSDAIGIWPNLSTNGNESELDFRPPLKRSRNFDDGNNESNNNSNDQCAIARSTGSYNPPGLKGTANIFFKTRLCAKFKTGTCRNGENCNFAHGMQDLRQPPHNWQELVGANVANEEERPSGNWDDDQRIIHKMKLCKKFYNGEECPYGDRCNFLHEDPSKFREEPGRFRENARESSAISIGTTGPAVALANNSSYVVGGDTNRTVNSSGLDIARANIKPVYWKTKLCTKWEMTGHCQFGDKCHFAHGVAELQVPNNRIEGEVGSSSSVMAKQPPTLHNTSPMKLVNVCTSAEEDRGKKLLMKLHDHKKLNRIYADWPDDVPLVQSSNLVEN